MPICTAVNASNNTACINTAKDFHGIVKYCGRHQNAGMRDDAEFRTAVNAAIAADTERRAQEEVAAAAAAAARAADREAKRLLKIARNERMLNRAGETSVTSIQKYARQVFDMWNDNNIEGYDIPKAYFILMYNNLRHENFVPLLRAVIKVFLQTRENHPTGLAYLQIPVAERTEALAGLRTALNPYELVRPLDILAELTGKNDVLTGRVRDRIRHLQAVEAERQRQRQAAQAAAQAAAPVVFQRDPANGIDLRAFATDTQSVHRSSVQDGTQRAILTLLDRPVPADQRTLPEIAVAFGDVRFFGTPSPAAVRTRALEELTNDYNLTIAFDKPYADVLDRVWAFIRAHVEKTELAIRLAQECCEGLGMCCNGKMARLVNVLRGYDETLEFAPPREMFQTAIARLMSSPLASRESAAKALFTEYQIPVEEHNVWLEPLLEV